MKRLFIEPLDVLMFRNERPFTRISSHVAKLGIISPSAFEGAIKSKIFTEFCSRKCYSPSDFQRSKKSREEDFKSRIRRKMESDKELKEILEFIGHPASDCDSKFNLAGTFLSEKRRKLEHFPVPNDIVQEDAENKKRVKIAPSHKIGLSQTKLNAVLPHQYSKVKKIDGLIELSELKRYLWGSIPQVKEVFDHRKLKKPYFKETRSGIQIERSSKGTVEGALYTAEFLRLLNNWGFVVWYESSRNIPDGIIKLGGDGKGATCENIKEINIYEKLNMLKLIEKINENKLFKLYLATPSYFGGCMPPNGKLEEFLGVALNLIAAIPGRPIYAGGYDFAMNKEKLLRKWVNAGAVYFYVFEGEIRRDLKLPIKIVEDNVDMKCAFIGGYKNV